MSTETTPPGVPRGWLFREGDLAVEGDGPRIVSPSARMLTLSLDELPRALLFFDDRDGYVLGSARVVDVDGGLDQLDLADPADAADFHAHREVLYRCLGTRLREEILRAHRAQIAAAHAAGPGNEVAVAEARRSLWVEALPTREEREQARRR
jgi:hypothetical protein